MKRLLCLAAALLLAATPAAALSLKDYRYEDAALTMSLPDGEDWIVLASGTTPSQQVLDFFEADEETLMDALDQNNIRFEAVTTDRLKELIVVISRSADTRRTFHYTLADPEDLKEHAQTYVDEDFSESSPGLDYLSYELVPAGDLLYIRFEGEVKNETTDSRFIQYATICNGYMVNIALHSFDGEMSQQSTELIDSVAQSVRFDAILDKSQDAQRYIDFAVFAGVLILAALSLVLIYRSQKKKQRAQARQQRALSDSCAPAPSEPAPEDTASGNEPPQP